jgi:hypothetical protein
MKADLTASGVLALVGVSVAAYLAWKGYKGAGQLLADVKQAADQVKADVQSGWKNNVATPFARGQAYANGEPDPLPVSTKAWLYSDAGYTGVDAATGQLITDGEWYGDAVARRYDAEQRALGATPPATSINGAAFGIYPRP